MRLRTDRRGRTVDRGEGSTQRGHFVGHLEQHLAAGRIRPPPVRGRVRVRGADPEQGERVERPGFDAARDPVEPHRDVAGTTRPLELDTGRDEVRVRHAEDHVLGLGRRAHRHRDPAAGLRERVQPERHLDDHAERSVRTGEQLAQVVPGDVLDHLAAGLGHDTVGPDHGRADDEVANRSVQQPGRPGRRRRDQTSDGAAARRVDGEPLAGRGEPGLEVVEPHTRLRDRDEVTGGVLDQPVQPGQVEHDVAPIGCRAPLQPGPGSPRHDRQAAVGRQPQDRRHLVDRGRRGDPARTHTADWSPSEPEASDPWTASLRRLSTSVASVLIRTAPRVRRSRAGGRPGACLGPHRRGAASETPCRGWRSRPGRTRSAPAASCRGRRRRTSAA